jgi:WD40 repeat protein
MILVSSLVVSSSRTSVVEHISFCSRRYNIFHSCTHHTYLLSRKIYIYISTGKKKYAFKCHRVNDTVYPVNTIAFHPTFGTFATGGADGSVVTWDANNKKKLCSIAKCPTSIACLAFNHDGTQLAMASSYTFEEGERDHPREEIYVRDVLESEVRPKAKK